MLSVAGMIMHSVRIIGTATLLSATLVFFGCSDSAQKTSQGDHGHDHASGAAHDHGAGGHTHEKSGTPHNGTPVQVGDHGYHLELVNDTVGGKLMAYVLDGHMEKQVAVPATTFELVAKTGGQEHRLTFSPVTNAPNATAEKTSVFAAPAEQLKNVTAFEGTIAKITLDGKTFENISFTYPKGTRHTH